MQKLLDSIKNKEDLKKLNEIQLEELSKEIRDLIINTTLKNGGHLASNLGVVELTIALHYIFNFDKDRLIFDVSHQCYTHKILTGRKDYFDTLRQLNGLSGFTNKNESECDVFTTGHAGTAISTALGLSCAYEHTGVKNKVISLVGDASIVNGMSFEALNHSGHIKKNLIVVLNDNNMSISNTIGSLSKYLNKIRISPSYLGMKKYIIKLLDRVPLLGHKLNKFIGDLKEKIKHKLIHANLFSDLGFNYFGPVDGHNISKLLRVFEAAKDIDGPVFVHVITEKGRGLKEAEENPTKFHGISPIIKSKSEGPELLVNEDNQKSFTETFTDTMIELGIKDKRICAITAAMPDGTGLSNFQKLFPDRFYDTGITESHSVGLASGLATGGMIPVVAIYSTFLQRAYDQIMHDIVLQDLHAVFIIDRAGIVGNDGATHQGLYDIAYLRNIPNVMIMSPKDNNELAEMLKFAVYDTNKCVFIRFPKASNPVVKRNRTHFKYIKEGEGELILKGNSIILLALGPMVEICKSAVNLLDKNIKPILYNMRFVKPIDEKFIEKILEKNLPIITFEEHTVKGGFGSAILEIANKLGYKNNIKVIGAPDKFIEHGNRLMILEQLGLNPKNIKDIITKEYNRYIRTQKSNE